MSQFDKYSNPAFGFQLDYPKAWNKLENIGGSVVSFSPENDTSAHNPCLNVVVQDLSGNPTTTLDNFTKISIAQIQQMLPEIDDVRVIERPLSECEGKHVEYLTTLQGTKLKFLQAFTLKENTAYIITFSAPETSHIAYSHMIEQCLQSFQIIKRRGITSLSLVPYYNPEFSYTLRVPLTWEPKEAQGKSVVRFEFKEDNKPVITLLVTAKKVGTLDQEKYTALLQEQVLESSTLKSLPKITSTTLGGYPANRTSFYSDSLQVPGRYELVWTVQNGHVGVLTFIHSVPEDDPDQDLYNVMFERIAESYRFANPDDADEKDIRYENLPQRFAIHYPRNYIQQDGFMGSTVSFSKNNDTTAFPANLNVVVQDMGSQPMSLDDFCEMLRQQLEFSVQNCTIVSVTDMVISGGQGREFIYTGMVDKDNNVKFVQRVVVKDDVKAAVISFASDKRKFDAEYAIAGPCLNTFTFL